MMTVPYCTAWANCHTAKVDKCYCVLSSPTQQPCKGCKSCNGTGLIILVSGIEWECYKYAYPKWEADPRFDPRALVTLRNATTKTMTKEPIDFLRFLMSTAMGFFIGTLIGILFSTIMIGLKK